jgi:hypothetical protein
MGNRISEANDALWAALETGFGDAYAVVRNPKSEKAPAAPRPVACYVVQQDGKTPEILRVLCGPIYDLKLETRISFALIGKEADRRDARDQAVGELVTILSADPTLGGLVDYAQVDPPEPGDPDQLGWLADALTVPVKILLTAPTPAG